MPVEKIRPSLLARFLSRFVTRTSYGIGLAIPETMECCTAGMWPDADFGCSGIGAVGRLLGETGMVLSGRRYSGIWY